MAVTPRVLPRKASSATHQCQINHIGAIVGVRLEAGTIWLKTHRTDHINRMAPYGGIKQSGIGRRAGLDGILEYSQSHTFTSYEPAATS
jgi:acyl-CoA reductase-like NAD-dependent aldehyde dehydrogenase